MKQIHGGEKQKEKIQLPLTPLNEEEEYRLQVKIQLQKLLIVSLWV